KHEALGRRESVIARVVGEGRAHLRRRRLAGFGLDQRRGIDGDIAHALVVNLIAEELRQLLGDAPAEADPEAGLARAETAFRREVALAPKEVDAEGKIAFEKIGLREADVGAQGALRDEERGAKVLAAAQEILLADADAAENAFV